MESSPPPSLFLFLSPSLFLSASVSVGEVQVQVQVQRLAVVEAVGTVEGNTNNQVQNSKLVQDTAVDPTSHRKTKCTVVANRDIQEQEDYIHTTRVDRGTDNNSSGAVVEPWTKSFQEAYTVV